MNNFQRFVYNWKLTMHANNKLNSKESDLFLQHYGQHFRGNAYNSSPMVPTLYPPHYAVSANQPVLTSTPNLSEVSFTIEINFFMVQIKHL